MDKQKTEPSLVATDLTKFGFQDDTVILKCRICGAIISKTIGAILLGTPVKYGVCKKWSHGASVVKAIP